MSPSKVVSGCRKEDEEPDVVHRWFIDWRHSPRRGQPSEAASTGFTLSSWIFGALLIRSSEQHYTPPFICIHPNRF